LKQLLLLDKQSKLSIKIENHILHSSGRSSSLMPEAEFAEEHHRNTERRWHNGLINWQHNASLMKQSIFMTTKSLANNGRIQREGKNWTVLIICNRYNHLCSASAIARKKRSNEKFRK